MLVTFKSRAAADVVMYEQHAKSILELLHKDVKRGVITPDDIDAVLTRLEALVHESRSQMAAEKARHEPGEDEDDSAHEHAQCVSFATRAYPLLAMLREAKKSGHSVTWGVI